MTTSAPTDTSSGPVLAAEQIHKKFGRTEVLGSVNFSILEQERVCIVGPSGSGKTTFLRCLNLLEQPTSGRLFHKGQLVGEWHGGRPNHPIKLADHRRRIGMVFQHFELFPHLTALQNITLGPQRVLHVERRQAEEAGMDLLGRIGLESFANARPGSLSGGQRQRVAIARALAMEPDVVLFDEPTSALDAEMVDEVLEIMRKLADDGMTMVIVTHELGFARQVANRVVIMEHGAIIEEGPTDLMFSKATVQRTREILRHRNR